MKEIIFVIGGCRSGKSSFALDYANKHFRQKVFLATSQALDDEMKERILRHREVRGPDWITIEEPIKLEDALESLKARVDVVLIDCLTLWVSNLLMDGETEEKILSRAEAFVESMQKIPQSIIVVSNEVGAGIVPTNKMAREFRDIIGILNQKVAACSDTVVLAVAGLPHLIKGKLR
ncbi:MAG: bifunctional adenosylcobinamide kinase/adenosylcobinamide-phosphate guanylyltransferase [Deltaproteobacteria bacterium]|nr:bifunctional adenosylcobinamide kinase/adenosylcobinamide-phosphate guanylyltransferase [Deltaproteobacteria bacterium]